MKIQEVKTGQWYKAISSDMEHWFNYFFEIGDIMKYFSLQFQSDPEDEEYDVMIGYFEESSDLLLDELSAFTFEEVLMSENIKKYILISCFTFEYNRRRA